MTSICQISSEIGHLRRVIVHSPGSELLAVTPQTRRHFLYDDLIDLETAANEHRLLCAVLAQFADVYQVRSLLEETVQSAEARSFLLGCVQETTAMQALRQDIGQKSIDELLDAVIAGLPFTAGPFAKALEIAEFFLPPLPNLMFIRDAAIGIGNTLSIGSMRHRARWLEGSIMRTIAGFHPLLRDTPLLYDGSNERHQQLSLEGGDVHLLSEQTLLIGISERTSIAMLDRFSDLIFHQTSIRDILAVVLLDHRYAIHLDMVLSQIDHGLYAVHPFAFRGPQRAPILHLRRGRQSVTEPIDLWHALKQVGFPGEPVFCGGDNRTSQSREQWASGCNFFAIRPGLVLSYHRNEETLQALQKNGFRIVPAETLLRGGLSIGETERAVITLPVSELVRGGGGPRCLTCPITRDNG